MAITLITGKPGTMKTAFVIETALKLMEEGTDCYFCNFRGLNPDFNVLDTFSDWQDLPDGSTVFIDEIQEFTRDVRTNAKTEELPEYFTALEKHRHRGFTFYIVTQHPLFIHTHIRRLVDEHRHFVRTKGIPFATQRVWQHVVDKPEDYKEASLQSGCQTIIYKPNKEVFKHYESTVHDTHSSFKIPHKLKIVGGLCLLGLLIFGILTYKVYTSMNSRLDPKPTTKVPPQPNVATPVTSPASNLPASSPIVENVRLDSSLEYEPTRPFDERVYDYPKFSDTPFIVGCMSDSEKCNCYSQQMTKLDVSFSDCKAFLKNRPFDPYQSLHSNSSNSSGVSPSSDRFQNPEELSSLNESAASEPKTL